MALTSFQRTVCAVIARNRIASGLSQILGAPRLSNDIDRFGLEAEGEPGSLKVWEQNRGWHARARAPIPG